MLTQPATFRNRALLAGSALLLATVLLLGREVELHLAALEAWMASLGPAGIALFIGLFALATSLFVPEMVLGIAAGALFGLPGGLAVALAGSLLAGALQYGIAWRFLRARIQRTLGTRPRLAAIQTAVLQDELRLQALLRLTPLNPAILSYLLGAAGVRFPTFLAACLALTPHLFIEVYLGHAGRNLARMAGGRGTELPELLVMLGGLAAAALVLLIVSRAAHRALLKVAPEVAR